MILYYSNSRKPTPFLQRVHDRLAAQAADAGQQLVTIVAKPLSINGPQMVQPQDRTAKPWVDLFQRILLGLRVGAPDPNEMVYLAEDDVLYPFEHFQKIVPAGVFGHNFQLLYCCAGGYFQRYNCRALLLSMYIARAGDLARACERKLAEIYSGTFSCVEPAGPDYPAIIDTSTTEWAIDIRHIGKFNHSWDAANAAADPDVRMVPSMPGLEPHETFWRSWSPDRP